MQSQDPPWSRKIFRTPARSRPTTTAGGANHFWKLYPERSQRAPAMATRGCLICVLARNGTLGRLLLETQQPHRRGY